MILTFVFLFIIIFLVTVYVIGFKKINKKSFFFFIFISLSTGTIYFYKGNLETFFFEEKLNAEVKKALENPEDFKKIDPNKLIIYLEKKLTVNPKDVKGWLILARTCIISGYFQKADLHYNNALLYFPNNEDILLEYSILKKNTNQPKAATKLLLNLKTFYPQNIRGRETLIEILISNQKYSLAKTEIEELINIKKEDEIYLKEIKKKFKFKRIQDY